MCCNLSGLKVPSTTSFEQFLKALSEIYSKSAHLIFLISLICIHPSNADLPMDNIFDSDDIFFRPKQL